MPHDDPAFADCLRAMLTAFRTGSPRPLDGFYAPDYVRHEATTGPSPARPDEFFYRIVGGVIVEGWPAAPLHLDAD